MVLFYDLSANHHAHPTLHGTRSRTTPTTTTITKERLNREHPLSRLLAAYPFLAGMAQWLDHTDLGNLSAACWQFRENMGQYRSGLLRASLRCCGDGVGPVGGEDIGAGGRALGLGLGGVRGRGREDWRRLRGGNRCVRDMVAGCRRCGRPYCRNCIHKPSKTTLDYRFMTPCAPCGALPAHPTSPPACTCDSTTWICNGCAEARWYIGSDRLCVLCHENPMMGPYEAAAHGKRARKICTWCKGMVWNVKDLQDINDMPMTPGERAGLTFPTPHLFHVHGY